MEDWEHLWRSSTWQAQEGINTTVGKKQKTSRRNAESYSPSQTWQLDGRLSGECGLHCAGPKFSSRLHIWGSWKWWQHEKSCNESNGLHESNFVGYDICLIHCYDHQRKAEHNGHTQPVSFYRSRVSGCSANIWSTYSRRRTGWPYPGSMARTKSMRCRRRKEVPKESKDQKS